jgi:polyhydroxyalkanoate synthesis repressor PhaR
MSSAGKPNPKKKRRPGRPPRSSKGDDAARKVPEGIRVIKRYGNRRMYDTLASQACTMSDLESIVRRGEDVRVIDGDTGEDLTRRTLVQLLLEQDNAVQLEILPVELLRVIIQARSHESVAEITDFVRRVSTLLVSHWVKAGKAATEMLRSMAPASDNRADSNDPMAELAQLQRQMTDLTARMFGRK